MVKPPCVSVCWCLCGTSSSRPVGEVHASAPDRVTASPGEPAGLREPAHPSPHVTISAWRRKEEATSSERCAPRAPPCPAGALRSALTPRPPPAGAPGPSPHERRGLWRGHPHFARCESELILGGAFTPQAWRKAARRSAAPALPAMPGKLLLRSPGPRFAPGR